MMAAAAMTGGSTGGLAGIANDVLGLKGSSDIFVGILGSRTVADKLIEQFDLKKVYGDSGMEDLRRDLAEHTAVSVDRKSQIISIMVTDRSPQRAAAMAQAYIQELNHLVADLSTSSARRERVFLEERLHAVNKDLEDAERDFSQFASKNTAVDVKEQAKAMVEAAATLQGEMIAAESQYEGLRQIYTDNNPRVRTIKARIDELQRQLDKLGGKGESATDVASTPSDSFYPSIRKLPLLGVTYADLYRRTRIQEAVLEALTKEYEMAKVQEVKEIPAVKILDSPPITDKKSFPPRFANPFLRGLRRLLRQRQFGYSQRLFGTKRTNATLERFLRKRFLAICGGACLDLGRGTVPARVEQGKSRWLSIKTGERDVVEEISFVVCDCLRIGLSHDSNVTDGAKLYPFLADLR